jgi:NADP-dependent 3-hydroxy acid dehydrogenase YdfG
MSALSKGNIAVVTGAASGIGLAAARRLAGMGLIVCMVDRSETALVAAAKEVGSNATPFVVDVADQAAMHRLAREVADRFGPVSFLMNNAGIGGGGDALSNPDGWTRVLDVNLFGVLHGVQAFVPAI